MYRRSTGATIHRKKSANFGQPGAPRIKLHRYAHHRVTHWLAAQSQWRARQSKNGSPCAMPLFRDMPEAHRAPSGPEKRRRASIRRTDNLPRL
ncbi:hypothetical protein C8Q79DRAFT_82508 [Trametes meyenii]|nr:hypothetical protein C8Q79DRAFT_82508 [Trametes meyenii]